MPHQPTFIPTSFATKTLLFTSPKHSLTSQRPFSKPTHQTLRRRTPPQSLVVEIKSRDDLQKVFTTAPDHLVVIDYSTTWCGPCKIIAPKFEEMSEEHKDVVFVKVMGDSSKEAGELMKKEGVRSVPAFHFWKNGERVLQVNGAKASAIAQGIAEHK